MARLQAVSKYTRRSSRTNRTSQTKKRVHNGLKHNYANSPSYQVNISNSSSETVPNTKWFNASDFKSPKKYMVKTVSGQFYGYALPHAGIQYTADIIQHTLRFRPSNYRDIRNIVIFYYPAFDKENVRTVSGKRYYHEYFVPLKSIQITFGKEMPNLKFYGYNVRDGKGTLPTEFFQSAQLGKDTWIIISADYSHFIPFQQSIELENRAAMALCYKKWDWSGMSQAVDNVATFEYVFTNVLPNSATLRWVGRSRSLGKQGVGYLSFLILDEARPMEIAKTQPHKRIDGIFVTAYDTDFQAREYLGSWFNYGQEYSKKAELDLVNDVLTKARTTSRLTGGMRLDIPVRFYTVSYLYRVVNGTVLDNKNIKNQFIRGYHGIMANGAFYLPDVFLENTYEFGQWIQMQNEEWQRKPNSNFDMTPTQISLSHKSGSELDTGKYVLYDSYVKHVML